MKTIFVAAPFYKWLQENEMLDCRKNMLEQLISTLRGQGYQVYNAHEREAWGKNWLNGDICTPLDYQQISDSELVIAFVGPPFSGGVHIELGWSSAMNKKILMILMENNEYSNLVLGLNKISDVKKIYICDETADNIVKNILIEIEGWI